MQQQELAQMRQRDANLTALAAIGPRKKRKLDSPGGAAAGTEVGAATQPPRQAGFIQIRGREPLTPEEPIGPGFHGDENTGSRKYLNTLI